MADKRNEETSNIGPPSMNPFHWQTAPNLDLPPLSPRQQHRAAQHSLVGIPQHPYPIHAAAFHMPVTQANDLKPLVDSIKRLEREVVDNREVLSIMNKNSIDRLSDLVHNLKNNLERGQDVHMEKTKDEFNKFVSFATLRDEKNQLQHDLISERINKVMLNQERLERSLEKVEDSVCKLTDMFVNQIQSTNSELRFHRQQHMDQQILINAANSIINDEQLSVGASDQHADAQQKTNLEKASSKEFVNNNNIKKPNVTKRVERLNFKENKNTRFVPSMRITKPSRRLSRSSNNAAPVKNQHNKTSVLSALIASDDESSNNENGSGSEVANSYDSDNSDELDDLDNSVTANEREDRNKRPSRSTNLNGKKSTFNKTNLTFSSRRNSSRRHQDKVSNTSTGIARNATNVISDVTGNVANLGTKTKSNNKEDHSSHSNKSNGNGHQRSNSSSFNSESRSAAFRPKILPAAEEDVPEEEEEEEKALAHKRSTAKARSERALQRRETKPPEPFSPKTHKRSDDPIMIVHEGIKDPALIELVKKSQTYPLQLNRLEFSKIFELTLKGDSSTNNLTFKDMMPARRHLKMTCTATYLAMLYSTGELIKELLQKKYTRNEIEYGIIEFSKKYMSPKTLSRFLFWFHSNKINLYEDSRDKVVLEIENRRKQNIGGFSPA